MPYLLLRRPVCLCYNSGSATDLNMSLCYVSHTCKLCWSNQGSCELHSQSHIQLQACKCGLTSWCVGLQVEIMQGRSIDNAPWPCEDIGEGLKDDLTSCIDWHWLQVGAHALSNACYKAVQCVQPLRDPCILKIATVICCGTDCIQAQVIAKLQIIAWQPHMAGLPFNFELLMA